MSRTTANIVRVASFLLGAALAVIVALELGILRVSRPPPMPALGPPPSLATPKVHPLDTEPSARPRPARREAGSGTDVRRERRARPRRARRPDTIPPPSPAPPTPTEDAPGGSGEEPSPSPPDGPARAEPPTIAALRLVMAPILASADQPPAVLTQATGQLEAAARQLGRRDVVECVNGIYLARMPQQRRILLQCWRKLISSRDG